MPVPPAMFVLGGPKLMAAKTVAFEMLPAVTSASVAAILARLLWKRLPDWVKEDVSFRNNSSESSSDVERLAAVLDRIQAWIEACSEQLQRPVPYLYASFLIYWQLMAQQQRQRMLRQLETDPSDEGENSELVEGDIVHGSEDVDFENLKDMANLATWAYYIDDAADLQAKLETLHYELKTCVLPSRPGSVGYYVAIGKQADDSATNISSDQPKETMILGIRGTSTLEELLTDACGRSVSYEGPNRYSEDSGEGLGNSIRIDVLAQEVDQVYFGSEVDRLGDEGEGDVEVVSGHERICVEQDGHQCDRFDGDDRHSDSKHLPGRPLLRHSSNLDSQIRCHEGIMISSRRLFWQVRPVVEEMVVRGDHRLVIVGHSLGASAGSLLALMLRSKYPELVQTDRLHVYAFGPPPVLDYDSAIGASTYVTSVVHQSDLISRCSLANLTVFLEFLTTVSSEVLVAQDLAPSNPRAAGSLLMQLSKGDKGEPFWSEIDLGNALAEARDKVAMRDPDHLYVPGKLLLLESTGSANPQQGRQHPSTVGSRRYSCVVTDGTTPSLRVIEMNGYQMLGDHTTASYMAAIVSLAEK